MSVKCILTGQMPDINDIGAVPVTRKINDKTLDADIIITPDSIGAASEPVAKTVILSVSDWSDNTVTKTVTGMTTSSNIIVAAAPANHMAYAQAGVRCQEQFLEGLTFVCENTPTEELTVNVLVVG